jgi:hypothetical protein
MVATEDMDKLVACLEESAEDYARFQARLMPAEESRDWSNMILAGCVFLLLILMFSVYFFRDHF